MTWYADLLPCDYFPREAVPELPIAVGWLGAEAPFTRGEVESELLTKLDELVRHGWQPVHFMGWHTCDLCASPEEAERTGGMGIPNIFVPGEGVLFVAPAMITHYIRIHGYAPPSVFCRAVMACPHPRTLAYCRALAASGAVGWIDPRLAPEMLADIPPRRWGVREGVPGSGNVDPDLFTDDDVAELEGLWLKGWDVAVAASLAYAARRDIESALLWLRRAHRTGMLDPDVLASDARFEAVRRDERFTALLRDMALVVPCLYRVETEGHPTPIGGELDISGEDALVFRHDRGAVTIPWASIVKLELRSWRRHAKAGDGTLVIHHQEPHVHDRNLGFSMNTGGAMRPWSPETLGVLEERSGLRVETTSEWDAREDAGEVEYESLDLGLEDES